MNAGRLKGFVIPLLCLVVMAGCFTDNSTNMADFKRAQQYRKEALQAERQGDRERALVYMEKAQTMVPRVGEMPPVLPPRMVQPVHRSIAPAGGEYTCSNTGINQFSCF